MAQGNRSKELWLIPKRVNLHQTICLIDGIIQRKYSNTTWNAQKQDNLGVNLKRWGATKDGKNISQQSIRTLTASIPQYLGFLYINSNTTPNTICLTDVGMKLWNTHKAQLVKVKNLPEGEAQGKLITESKVILDQMEKLQISNPIISKDCENILVFPFRLTLKLLLELDYLDKEELAYFVFSMKDETEYALTLQEIRNFRKLQFVDRKNIIDAFKQTHIGNITLVKASSAGYYQSLCLITGIIDKISVTTPNPNSPKNHKLIAITIKDQYKAYVTQMTKLKYQEAETYDFKENLDLWIEYIGNPERLVPPRDVKITNKTKVDLLVRVKKDGALLDGDLVEQNKFLSYPMFLNEVYEIEYVDIESGVVVAVEEITPKHDNIQFNVNIPVSSTIPVKETFDDIASEIIEHSNSAMFSRKMLNYLSILYNIDGKSREDNKSLRGAVYEYLFYKLLSVLRDEGVIDEVIWNGKVGKYGLPSSAPGGTLGIADMVFIIDNTDFVLELTTIKPKALQFKAEGASVPDHVRLYKNQTTQQVAGIFSAPLIHSRNTSIMQSSLEEDKIKLNCITDKELLDILRTKDRNTIKTKLS